MFVIPAIDLIKGTCVRLTQGDYNQVTDYTVDPLDMAKQFAQEGAEFLHIVDLEGAKSGYPTNTETILSLAKNSPLSLQVGGGIRDYPSAEKLLHHGVDRIIMGTKAIQDPILLQRLVENFTAERILVSLDFKEGQLATQGWTETSPISLEKIISQLKSTGIRRLIVTDTAKDGLLGGPNLELMDQMRSYDFEIIAAGGVSTLQDIEDLRKIGTAGAIIGKALYEGNIDLKSALETAKPNNYLVKRIIPCLDIQEGRVVKGTHFTHLKDAGDAIELGKLYSDMGADELVFLDITATVEKRETLRQLVQRIAKEITIPFTVGGGIRTLEDIRNLLDAGADKVSIGSTAITHPAFITEASQEFGCQCIVISVDAKRWGEGWHVYIQGGRKDTQVDALSFSQEMEERGAGELLVNSLDKDGTKEGFDIALLRSITKRVNLPVIASSGAGNPGHFLEIFQKTDVDAALAASIFHYGEISIPELKIFLAEKNIPIRL